jgi:hypothetical protein
MLSQVWWYMPLISALKSLRQENHEFKASPGRIVKSYQEQGENKKEKRRERNGREGKGKRKCINGYTSCLS